MVAKVPRCMSLVMTSRDLSASFSAKSLTVTPSPRVAGLSGMAGAAGTSIGAGRDSPLAPGVVVVVVLLAPPERRKCPPRPVLIGRGEVGRGAFGVVRG